MRVAIIGATGVVGRELLSLFEGSHHSLLLFASKKGVIGKLHIEPLTTPIDCDIAFFCVDAAISKREIPRWIEHGTIVIDLSSAFRNTAPLVVPEINAHLISPPLIASPNCTTTLLLLPLAPLHNLFTIKRIITSTYQAASGGGQNLLNALLAESKNGSSPQSIAYNLLPHSMPDISGYNGEEEKMQSETCRILNDPSILLSATCIRVPTLRVHAISANVEFSHAITAKEAIEIVKTTPGICYAPGSTVADAEGKKEVYISRIREDKTRKNTLEFWILGDQLLKGAAYNAFQIFSTLSKCPS